MLATNRTTERHLPHRLSEIASNSNGLVASQRLSLAIKRSDPLREEQTTAWICSTRSIYGRLRFQPSRAAPSLPNQVPNEHLSICLYALAGACRRLAYVVISMA